MIWNALASGSGIAPTTLVVRHLARFLASTGKGVPSSVPGLYRKVAEFQTRGVVHFHVIIRLDGPDGPDEPPPEGLSVDDLADASAKPPPARPSSSRATPRRSAETKGALGRAARHPTDHRRRTGEGELTDQKVAGYVAKYATKGAENTGTLDRPVVCWRCKGAG